MLPLEHLFLPCSAAQVQFVEGETGWDVTAASIFSCFCFVSHKCANRQYGAHSGLLVTKSPPENKRRISYTKERWKSWLYPFDHLHVTARATGLEFVPPGLLVDGYTAPRMAFWLWKDAHNRYQA